MPEALTLDKCGVSTRCDVYPMRHGLYALVDIDALTGAGLAPVTFTDTLLASSSFAALQLRAKHLGSREFLATARALAPRCREAGVDFYVNDRPDIALLAGAAGVHVGLDDLPVDDVRRFAPGLRIGVSSHTLADVNAALDTDADYVAFGPVFGTRSKGDAAPTTGLDTLRAAAACCARVGRPLVAIGGITLANASLVREAGATAGAVISALMVGNVREVARALHAALGGE